MSKATAMPMESPEILIKENNLLLRKFRKAVRK
jgi:hypothetical protein